MVPHIKNKVKKFTIELIPTLNRAIVLSAYVGGGPLNFAIKHDKKSSALQFQVGTNNSAIKNGDVKIQMFRNLESCMFCKLFLKLETIKDEHRDYRGKFLGLNKLYERYMIQFFKEKYDFQVNEKNKPSKNYLLCLAWKLQDSDNDLLFYFVQRKCYSDVTRMNVIRTAGFQLATDRGLDYLNKYYIDSESLIRKANSEDNLPMFLDDSEVTEGDLDEEND